MSDEDFWCLSYREINALSRVHGRAMMRWALDISAQYNHIYPSDVPYIPDDFLGRGDRDKRVAKKQAEGMQDKMGLMMAEAQQAAMFQQIQSGITPADLPDWAFGRAGRPDGR